MSFFKPEDFQVGHLGIVRFTVTDLDAILMAKLANSKRDDELKNLRERVQYLESIMSKDDGIEYDERLESTNKSNQNNQD